MHHWPVSVMREWVGRGGGATRDRSPGQIAALSSRSAAWCGDAPPAYKQDKDGARMRRVHQEMRSF